ncbi:hypothetical protein FRC04_007744 [Tulasnella sp. 424]|nr:hypothetical protein FRC04_007744 [Tulasnella sp. 424]
MDIKILQSALDALSHLLIPPSQIALEKDAELGVGRYGQVFRAVLGSSDSQTTVAVKQLRIAQAEGVRRLEAIVSFLSNLHLFIDAHWSDKRLARELKIWAKAKHPNILALLGFYFENDYLYAHFVSEYMANGNVKEYINKFKPDLATRLRFKNILVNEILDAVLCDFGLARFIMEAGESSGLTTGKTPKGTLRCMAPELFPENEVKLTLESDVWVWACTTFETVDVMIMAAIIKGQPPRSVDLLDSLVSSGHTTYHLTLDSLKSIISACWIMDSAKRPSSSEILNRLIFPDGIEALDTATASSDSAMEDRQLELLPSPNTGSPTHGNVNAKRKGSPGLEGRLEKRARGKDAAIQTGTLHIQVDTDIVESVLDDLSHLLIPPSQIPFDNNAEFRVGDYSEVFLAVMRSSDSQTKVAVKQLRIARARECRRRLAIGVKSMGQGKAP